MQDAAAAGGQQQQQFFLQFATSRMLPNGEVRLRVTTLTRAWTDGSNTQHITAGFDQEAAAVVLARLATHKVNPSPAAPHPLPK